MELVVPKTQREAGANRKAALASGETRYVGLSCKNCGGVLRYTSVRRCIRCLDAQTKTPAGQERAKKFREKYRSDGRRHAFDLKRNFGITPSEYDRILKAQDGVCAICKRPPTNKRLAVDHEHPKGIGPKAFRRLPPEEKRKWIRGILCHIDNKYRVGQNTSETVKSVLEYLTNPPALKVLYPHG